MLCLTRRVGETVRIGEVIAVTVRKVKGNQVSLGIEAPRDVSIVREEIDDVASPEKAVDGDEAKRRSPPPDRDDKKDP